MNAKEYYESKEWGNPHWDRKTATQFDKSEMLDFAEHYHQAKLKLLGISNVSQQRELLAAFAEHLDTVEGQFTPSWMIDNFLKAANCG